MTEHTHGWEYAWVDSPKHHVFCCRCGEFLEDDEIERRLNEYETLKVTTERLRNRFELIRETVNTPDGKMTVLELFTQLDRACNDTLEEK